MRERGLKPRNGTDTTYIPTVAPHAGAWIEARREGNSGQRGHRRSPCGSVD